MKKHLLFFVILLFGVITAHPAVASGMGWPIWLYEPEHSRLMQVDLDGNVQEENVNFPAGMWVEGMVRSPDSNLIALCMYPTPDENSSSGNALFRIYGRHCGLFEDFQELGTLCTSGSGVFGESAVQFAFVSLPPDTLSDWSIQVRDGIDPI